MNNLSPMFVLMLSLLVKAEWELLDSSFIGESLNSNNWINKNSNTLQFS